MTPTTAPSKRYKATNNVTGEEVQFDWSNPEPPTQDDVNRISDDQRQSRLKLKQQQVGDESKVPFMDRLLMSKPVGAAIEFGKNFEWHPIDAAKQAASGLGKVTAASNPMNLLNPSQLEQTGKEGISGGIQAGHGVMGAVGPPAIALGMATNPLATGAAMAGAGVGTSAAQAMVPDDWDPEAKEAVGMAGGLIGGTVGGMSGHAIESRGDIPPAPPDVTEPKTGEIVRVPPQQQQQRTGVNYNEPPRSTRQRLPSAGPVPSGVSRPALPPSSVNLQPDSGQTIVPPEAQGPPAQSNLPQGAQQPQLPRGPIQAGPVAPIQMGPTRGYSPVGAGDEPPAPTSLQRPVPTQQRALPGPSAFQMGPVAPPTDVTRMYRPGGIQDEPQAPLPSKPVLPQQPTTDVVSATKPQPMSVTDVSTVSTPQSAAPPVQPPASMVQPPAQPPAQAPSQQAAPQTPPVRPQAPPQAAPPQAQLPQVQPPQVNPDSPAGLKIQADNILRQAKQTPAAPAPTTQQPGPVQSPVDIAKAAINRSGIERSQPTTPGNVTAPGAPQPKADVAQIPPQQQAQAQANNAVLDLMKLRKNVTPSQIQTKLGLPLDQVKPILDSLKQRGLVTQKGSTYNYNRVPGEDVPDIPPERGSTQQLPAAPAQAEPPEQSSGQVSPERAQRITQLKQMIDGAEEDGNEHEADMHRGKLELEEKAAQIEKTGTPEQKAALQQRDTLTQQAKELEDKEDSGATLSPEESSKLGKLYKQINALEINDFFQSEEGSSPSTRKRPGDDLNRSFFSRWAYSARNIVPPPGFADVRGISADLGSPNRVLRDSGIPGAVDIGRGTAETEVEKYKWLGTTMRQDARALKGLSSSEIDQVARALDVPGAELDDLKSSNLPQRVKDAAVYVRTALDKTFKMFPEGVKKSGDDVGYLSGYLPHIAKQFGDDSYFKSAINDAAQYYLGAAKGLTDLFARNPIEVPEASTVGDKANINTKRGISTPSSPNVESRDPNSRLDYTLDLKRILPMYRKLAAKVIFDKPWIDEARGHLARIPEDATTAREMATAYLQNYAETPDGYDHIRSKWDAFTNPLMRAHARSLLGLSSRLFTLHGARLLSQIYPEVPTKYFLQGAAKTIGNPIETYIDLGRRGILPSNVEPWFFKRPMAKVDSGLQGFSMFDAVPDAIGWHGLNQMYLDKGFDLVTAGNMATNRIMDLSMRSTPARMAKVFDNHGFMRPLLQYKQQILKIAEQYATQIPDAARKGTAALKEGDWDTTRAEYGRLLRYMFGIGATLYLQKKFGLTMFHLSENILNFGGGAYGAIFQALKKATTATKKHPGGNPGQALKDLINAFGVPAGREIESVMSGKGLTAFEAKKKSKQ